MNYPSFAHASAAQNCRNSFLEWRSAFESGAMQQVEEMKWFWYQHDCECYKIVTGNEFKPVLWQEAK